MKRIFLLSAMTLVLAVTGWAQAEDGLKLGLGVGFLSFTNIQKISSGGSFEQSNSTYQFIGINAFVEPSPYFNFYAGLWKGLGDATSDETGVESGSASETNNLVEYNLGAVLKYPFHLNDLTISPKIGVDYLSYLSGDVGGSTPDTADTKQSISPLSILAGADLDWNLNDGWFVRVPLSLAVALNAKLSDDFYGGFYDSSSLVSFNAGVQIGHKL